jgi:hypothetical protein
MLSKLLVGFSRVTNDAILALLNGGHNSFVDGSLMLTRR